MPTRKARLEVCDELYPWKGSPPSSKAYLCIVVMQAFSSLCLQPPAIVASLFAIELDSDRNYITNCIIVVIVVYHYIVTIYCHGSYPVGMAHSHYHLIIAVVLINKRT